MSGQLVRRRLTDGTHGPLEPAFPDVVEVEPETLMFSEAIAGQQEQIEQLATEIEALKGGAK
ncbi:hypothetical protein NCCP2222_01730 [Sporosarcina sp. NCCP-2222]|uniref:hypothetical protein n=1 Tax=Sporosarcina sp. NCCP-2222 TaxID=2935073 RepID=UPI0020825DE2|nr:hypothetical protein [Sporosarcina sp. NCCP-2222]GKV54226.1 hypothetical protein NCCP2222_01730 [Sporosarcina sp. NCCP-2222]